MKKRPNILFLMCDQHRFDFTGYEGHITRTPNLDWQAGRRRDRGLDIGEGKHMHPNHFAQ